MRPSRCGRRSRWRPRRRAAVASSIERVLRRDGLAAGPAAAPQEHPGNDRDVVPCGDLRAAGRATRPGEATTDSPCGIRSATTVMKLPIANPKGSATSAAQPGIAHGDEPYFRWVGACGRAGRIRAITDRGGARAATMRSPPAGRPLAGPGSWGGRISCRRPSSRPPRSPRAGCPWAGCRRPTRRPSWRGRSRHSSLARRAAGVGARVVVVADPAPGSLERDPEPDRVDDRAVALRGLGRVHGVLARLGVHRLVRLTVRHEDDHVRDSRSSGGPQVVRGGGHRVAEVRLAAAQVVGRGHGLVVLAARRRARR